MPSKSQWNEIKLGSLSNVSLRTKNVFEIELKRNSMITLPQFMFIANAYLQHSIGTNFDDESPTICVYSQRMSMDCNWNKMQR